MIPNNQGKESHMISIARFLIVAMGVILLSSMSVFAADNITVSVKGAKQGQFKGESMRDKGGDKIQVIAYSFEVTSPRDAASGMASGRRQYKPLEITKELGASSPQFFQACATNEVLPTVVLEFTRTNPNGEMFVYYTIKLT